MWNWKIVLFATDNIWFLINTLLNYSDLCKAPKSPMCIMVCSSSILLVDSSFLEMVICFVWIKTASDEKGVLQNLQCKDTCQVIQKNKQWRNDFWLTIILASRLLFILGVISSVDFFQSWLWWKGVLWMLQVTNMTYKVLYKIL